MSEVQKKHMSTIEQTAVKLLETAMTYGQTFIITNAMRGENFTLETSVVMIYTRNECSLCFTLGTSVVYVFTLETGVVYVLHSKRV